MEQLLRKGRGVTLLEVLLVLAIASIIIVLSIRYYQSATTSEQANAAMSVVQSITAGMDSLQATVGSYAGITQAQLTNVVGSNNMTSPVGGAAVTMTNASGATYNITIPLSPAVCTIVSTRLSANTKFTSVACDGSGKLTYTYNSAQ